jgi:DNA-binding transcriptional MerR regulator
MSDPEATSGSDAEAAAAPSAATEPGPTKPVTPAAPATGMSRARRLRRRTFYSIGEVCEMFDLKPHVLRYWETQFDQLRPSKNRAGVRVYQGDEMETIALIRKLVHEERYTIEGARKRIEELRSLGSEAEVSSRSLESAYLRALRGELESLANLLDPTPVNRGPVQS